MATVRGRALFHVGVHAEEYGVVVRILKADNVHVRAERHLVHEVQLQRADTTFLDFFFAQTVENPFHITAMVHVMVQIKVAIAGAFRIN